MPSDRILEIARQGCTVSLTTRGPDQLEFLLRDWNRAAPTGPIRVFVTVGTELPFDRLVRAVDDWADRQHIDGVFAQIGDTSYRPEHIRWTKFLGGSEFDRVFTEADVIVSHAGMGTILSALNGQRRLLVMPRRAELGEHRNDHQIATTRRLSELEFVQVADDTDALSHQLDDLDGVAARSQIGPYAQPSLIDAVRKAIHR